MPLLKGKRTPHRDASPQDELERIDKALGRYRHLANARAFIDGTPGVPVTLATVAQAIGISPSHLARLFQEKVGTSFHHWLTLRRVHLAMAIMRSRPATALQVAHLSGFSSYRSFARAFKNVIGIPPSGYRKQVERHHAAKIARN